MICLTVLGIGPDGAQTLGFQSFERCRPPALRLGDHLFDLAVHGIVWEQLVPSGDFERLLERGPRDRRLYDLARYFCEYPRSPLRGSKRVALVVEYHAQRYSTGAVQRHLGVVHSHDCASRRSSLRDEIELVATRDASGRIGVRARAR